MDEVYKYILFGSAFGRVYFTKRPIPKFIWGHLKYGGWSHRKITEWLIKRDLNER